jgi:hypothetical protein
MQKLYPIHTGFNIFFAGLRADSKTGVIAVQARTGFF